MIQPDSFETIEFRPGGSFSRAKLLTCDEKKRTKHNKLLVLLKDNAIIAGKAI
jgi:hypothetical protein